MSLREEKCPNVKIPMKNQNFIARKSAYVKIPMKKAQCHCERKMSKCKNSYDKTKMAPEKISTNRKIATARPQWH